ncbi:zinc finger protein 771-like [Cydia strobilella]|uniref:zinc finger protein 771-like n=1 Tax=Cydia strobilella TaxID=1100964 RepID=UPI0030057B3A
MSLIKHNIQHNSNGTMDYSTVCRTCLGKTALRPIFASNADYRRHASAVFITTGIKVEINDGLPQQMCTTCINYINSSLKFRRQCKNSENRLLQLNQSNDSNKETLTNSNKIDDCDTEDLKCNILKTELKYEFELPDELETVKCEDSVGGNGTPLGCFKTKNNEEKGCDVLEDVKVIGNTKCVKKSKVQRVSCTICGKDLSVRSIRAHVATRHAGLRCGYCKLEHGSKEALATHAAQCPLKKKRRVSDSGKELVSCDVCHKRMQRNSLRAHQAVKHKGLGPVCEHCGRRFGNKLRLSEHLRAKHGYDKLQCSHCEFKSSSRAALENHERRHRGEKPFVCETCGAKFHAAYLLAQHRHSHRTEKRIKCGLCGAAFKATNSLHAHRAARHGARCHRCPLCARAYSCRHYAVKHLRAVHGFKGTVPPLQVDPAPT